MRYLASQIKLKPQKRSPEELIRDLTKAIGRKDIRNLRILRESIDARRKPDVKLVYTVEFECDKKLRFDKADAKARTYEAPVFPQKLRCETVARPVIAGFGPCGIFAALVLAEAGLRPIVIERGKSMDERIRDVEEFWNRLQSDPEDDKGPDPESNVQFGEGGAGTFSDGKLTTGIHDVRIRKVLEEFVKAGADPVILYKAKPHIGTDKLREIVPNLRSKIEELGGEVRFQTRLEDVRLASFDECSENDADQANAGDRKCRSGKLHSVTVTDLGKQQTYDIPTDTLVLAIGHSARDTFRRLYGKGLTMERKPFSIGMRIQHPQDKINEAQYGDGTLAEILGPADYKLNHRCENGRGVYTFCMCPGGHVINASSEAKTAVTNGMSNSDRSAMFANSAVLVDVRPEDVEQEDNLADPLSGIAFQEHYEHLAWEVAREQEGDLPMAFYRSFKDEEEPIRKCLPAFASEAILEAMPHFGRKLKGFDDDLALFIAVESRSSSPVRIKRDENMQALGHAGILPAGEGPGYAGGIMSAAVDGIRAAEKIIGIYTEKYSQKCGEKI